MKKMIKFFALSSLVLYLSDADAMWKKANAARAAGKSAKAVVIVTPLEQATNLLGGLYAKLDNDSVNSANLAAEKKSIQDKLDELKTKSDLEVEDLLDLDRFIRDMEQRYALFVNAHANAEAHVEDLVNQHKEREAQIRKIFASHTSDKGNRMTFDGNIIKSSGSSWDLALLEHESEELYNQEHASEVFKASVDPSNTTKSDMERLKEAAGLYNTVESSLEQTELDQYFALVEKVLSADESGTHINIAAKRYDSTHNAAYVELNSAFGPELVNLYKAVVSNQQTSISDAFKALKAKNVCGYDCGAKMSYEDIKGAVLTKLGLGNDHFDEIYKEDAASLIFLFSLANGSNEFFGLTFSNDPNKPGEMFNEIRNVLEQLGLRNLN